MIAHFRGNWPFYLILVLLFAFWRWAYHCDHNINSRVCHLHLVNLIYGYTVEEPR